MEIQELFKNKGIRTEVDLRNEKISYKVREHSSKKVPIILAIGKNEKADNTVSIRRIGSNDSKVMDLDNEEHVKIKENTLPLRLHNKIKKIIIITHI